MDWVFHFLFASYIVCATQLFGNPSDNSLALTESFDPEVAECSSDMSGENIIGENLNFLSDQTPNIIRRDPAICKIKKKQGLFRPFRRLTPLPIMVPTLTTPTERSDLCPIDRYSLLLSCGGSALFYGTFARFVIYKSVANCVEGIYWIAVIGDWDISLNCHDE